MTSIIEPTSKLSCNLEIFPTPTYLEVQTEIAKPVRLEQTGLVVMRLSANAPVPSPTLLRFLKFQSDSLCFFNPNHRPGFIFDHAAPRHTHVRSTPTKKLLLDSSRSLSTTVPRRATLEAGFLSSDFLFPRPAISALRPEARQPNGICRHQQRRWNPQSVCHSSSNGRRWWHLWGSRTPRGGTPLLPDDLPNTRSREESTDDSMFSLGRHISAKAAAQPKLRCTELDEYGNIILTSGEFKKSELIQKVHQISFHNSSNR